MEYPQVDEGPRSPDLLCSVRLPLAWGELFYKAARFHVPEMSTFRNDSNAKKIKKKDWVNQLSADFNSQVCHVVKPRGKFKV